MVNLSDARGKPRFYKGLYLHPIKIKDVEEFYWSVECLLYPKSSSKNLKVLRMTYLDFLINLMLGENLDFNIGITTEELKMKFGLLLNLVFKTSNIEYRENELGIFELIFDNDIKINGQEFEEIKKIIGSQNGVDTEDKFMNDQVRKKMNETREFLNKQNSDRVAQMDQQIIAYHCVSKLSYEEIDELTIYQFQKGLSRFNHMIECENVNIGIYTGSINLEKNKKAPHWLDLIKYSDSDSQLKIDSNEFIGDLSNKGLVNKN